VSNRAPDLKIQAGCATVQQNRATLLEVELAERTQHPLAVDIGPVLIEVVGRRQLEAGLVTLGTIRLADMPVGVGHVLEGPGVRLPDPRRCARRRVSTLTTRPVSLISAQAEHSWPLADMLQSLCTQVGRSIFLARKVKKAEVSLTPYRSVGAVLIALGRPARR